MEKENPKYIKGFNHAYLLVKYKPEIIKSLTNIKTQNDYIQGLKDGNDIFEQSRIKSRLYDLRQLETKRDKDHDLDLKR
ncbi:hypothetical protein MC378_12330 [Polaribacter sp. MSW13]|uniref:Uncharacterized protein n=1 Tax=Polaribacter marinus TaxID=2916838 RepID=A0A9X1VPH0_9FLAO|nr:hypothetical protein [Polaribacter marinus]MCI2229956.1 hypothetical protein [Polaribacter marinus]